MTPGGAKGVGEARSARRGSAGEVGRGRTSSRQSAGSRVGVAGRRTRVRIFWGSSDSGRFADRSAGALHSGPSCAGRRGFACRRIWCVALRLVHWTGAGRGPHAVALIGVAWLEEKGLSLGVRSARAGLAGTACEKRVAAGTAGQLIVGKDGTRRPPGRAESTSRPALPLGQHARRLMPGPPPFALLGPCRLT